MAKFSQALETDVIQEDLKLENREMKLHQLIITADSPFVGKTMAESGIRSIYGCMVVGIEEGKENLSPVHPTRRFAEGDIIWVVGEEESFQALNTTAQH
jgi:CPA2 family monovalent cation:H+ antiporter-2